MRILGISWEFLWEFFGNSLGILWEWTTNSQANIPIRLLDAHEIFKDFDQQKLTQYWNMNGICVFVKILG